MNSRVVPTRDDVLSREFQSILHILDQRASANDTAPSMHFFHDQASRIDQAVVDAWSWLELQTRARNAAAQLLTTGARRGSRVLLIYPPGLAFVAAFYGCLYADMVPVPVPPPRRSEGLDRWRHVVRDAAISGVLTTSDLVATLKPLLDAVAGDGFCLSPSDVDPAEPFCCAAIDLKTPIAKPDDLAFLQYTSGSTSEPKGVMISHGNLMANLRQIQLGYELTSEDWLASWLPHFHDMGLLGNILAPVYSGFKVGIMAPGSFLRRPHRWLEMASDYGATILVGPNFGYDHCARRTSPASMDSINLSKVRLAAIGAETIRPRTLSQFHSTFAPVGFRWNAFFCCYGMAEATVFISAISPIEPPTLLSVDRDSLLLHGRVDALEQDGASDDPSRMTLTSCGHAVDGLEIAIVDPTTRLRHVEGVIGEIWIRGPNVSAGYWQRAEQNSDSFDLVLDGHAEWFRTGDLGFLRDANLYVTGRLKDLIVIRGENHYPQDIEETAAACHSALAGAGAFSLEICGEERIGIVCELTRAGMRDLDAEAVFEALRGAISRQHDLQLSSAALVRPGSLPRTPSGKVQRFACRNGLAESTLPIVARWDSQSGDASPRLDDAETLLDALRRVPQARREEVIRQRLQGELARLAGLPTEQLPPADTGFFDLGLDSVAAVDFATMLERELRLRPEPTLLFEHPNVGALSAHLAATVLLDAPATANAASEADSKQPPTMMPLPSLRVPQQQSGLDDRIAVVGMAGRFPGADDLDQFWAMLDQAGTGLRKVDEDELAAAGVSSETANDPDYVPMWGGFADPTAFDAAFFGYSPREAELLDPQQRVFLECAWAALEHAGYDSRRYAGSIGVYAGGALTSYLLNFHGHRTLRETVDPIQVALSHVNGLVASRVSYHLDLRGPSCGVQTTCSTSLVAVHQAARSLLARECDTALAGGVAVGQPRPAGYLYKPESIMAPDGVCRPFDAAARGTIFTNGVGVVVLKRLSDALADNDTIYGVILGSAVNNDGAGKVGITAPSVAGQTAVLKAALAAARIDAATIDYVETHGTGTALGDPIEIAALNRAYGPAFRRSGTTCALGAVKANIGHLDAAAGVAGLIKVLLALHHRRMPAVANFAVANPACDFTESPFRVLHAPRDWQCGSDRPRRASVSSFGIGGTNAHVIVEEAPKQTPSTTETDELHVLPLSARTPEALARSGEALERLLGQPACPPIGDVAYTLQMGRRPMAERSVRLSRNGQTVAGTALNGKPSLIFQFTGQGAQHLGMARGLYDGEPVFRAAFDACLKYVPKDLDLRNLIWSATAANAAGLLNRTEATQPALFAVEYALAQLWIERGLRPTALIGHSIGEYVAACLAGVFSLEDAMRVVCARGRLMQACPPGAMLSAMLSEAEASAFLSDRVELAVMNGPRSIVLGGQPDAIRALAELFDRRGIGHRLLKTSHAFHTSMMEPALADFEATLTSVKLNAPAIDIASNVTGDWLKPEEATDPSYWVRHLRKAVRFSDGLGRLMELPNPLLLEIGPGSTLTRLARQQRHENARAVASLPDDNAGEDDAAHALMALGQLWIAGLDIDWERMHLGSTRRRVALPTYPFERTSYWIAPAAPADAELEHPPRRDDLETWFHQPSWERTPLSFASAAGPARWLMLGGMPLANAVGELPASVDAIWVAPGLQFSSAGGYQLDPLNGDHYRALLADLASNNWKPDQVVIGFGLDATTPPAPGSPGALFESALAFGRSVVDSTSIPPLLTLVGSGMQQVTGQEALDPGAGMALGLASVLSQELPGLRCRTIDVGTSELSPAGPVRGLAEALMRPFRDTETAGALRSGFFWRQSYAPAPSREASEVPLLRSGATYLVAGDLVDGLALIYANALVKNLGAKVLLLGRAGLPAPSEWDRWLASHSPHHGISQLVHALRGLGEVGVNYQLYSGSLTDVEWVSSAVADGEAQLGPVHAVFHTAGMGHQYYATLADTTADTCQAVFDAKFGALHALEQALAKRPPAFYLVQSSLSSLVGGTGLAAYASANTYLDTFVSAHAGAGGAVWQAINWDVCQTHATSESGGSTMLADAITPDEVWRVTRAMLAQPAVSRVAVTPASLRKRMQASIAPALASSNPSVASPASRRVSTAPYVAPRDTYEKAVAAAMSDLLGIERIGANDNFFELGGHSLLAIQIVTRLRREFEVELPMRALLFEAPTVAGIAQAINQAVNQIATERATVSALLDDIEAAVNDQQASRRQA